MLFRTRGVAQVVAHSAVNVWILLHGEKIQHGECICSLGYFPGEAVLHNWSIKVCSMCYPFSGKVDMKDPLLLIGKSSLFGNSRFPLKEICHNDYMLVPDS